MTTHCEWELSDEDDWTPACCCAPATVRRVLVNASGVTDEYCLCDAHARLDRDILGIDPRATDTTITTPTS